MIPLARDQAIAIMQWRNHIRVQADQAVLEDQAEEDLNWTNTRTQVCLRALPHPHYADNSHEPSNGWNAQDSTQDPRTSHDTDHGGDVGLSAVILGIL
jgi:hypothetical protein